jgi:hypothetical protein
MRLDANEKAHTTQAMTEGTGSASESLQLLTVLKSQGVVIWKPSQIFGESEEGASSRKGARPFAFCCADCFAGNSVECAQRRAPPASGSLRDFDITS